MNGVEKWNAPGEALRGDPTGSQQAHPALQDRYQNRTLRKSEGAGSRGPAPSIKRYATFGPPPGTPSGRTFGPFFLPFGGPFSQATPFPY